MKNQKLTPDKLRENYAKAIARWPERRAEFEAQLSEEIAKLEQRERLRELGRAATRFLRRKL